MKKISIIPASFIGAVSLVATLSVSAVACAQVSARALDRADLSATASTTIRARIEARYGSTTPGMRVASTTRETSEQRVTAIQGRSDTEITQRIASLDQILSRIDSMKNISSSDQASLVSSIQAEITDLTSLKAAIDADTSTSTLKADYQSITKSYRVYALVLPQASIIAAADRILDLVTSFNVLTSKLRSSITTAQSNGMNASSSVSAIADIAVKAADAGVQANAAISLVSGLQPDQGVTTALQANTAALKSARTDIKTATADLAAARKDVNVIVNAVKSSIKATTGASTPTSASASTTATTTTP